MKTQGNFFYSLFRTVDAFVGVIDDNVNRLIETLIKDNKVNFYQHQAQTWYFLFAKSEFILGQKVSVEKSSVEKCLGRKIKGFILELLLKNGTA